MLFRFAAQKDCHSNPVRMRTQAASEEKYSSSSGMMTQYFQQFLLSEKDLLWFYFSLPESM